jgi:hypothetical protein
LPERPGPGESDPTSAPGSDAKSLAAIGEILVSAGLRAAVRAVSSNASLEPALQSLVDEYGRATGASAAILAMDGSKAMPIGATWLYEASADTADTPDGAVLEEMARELRDRDEPELDPGRSVEWRSREEGGATCDFIASPVHVRGLPPAALCAALAEPADPPDAVAAVTQDFAALAGLCLLGHQLTGAPEAESLATRPSCLEPDAIRKALAAELSRCGLSREALSVCFVTVSAGETAESSSQDRLTAILGQVLAEASQPYDFVGQVDDELLIVMPGADHNGGMATARHLMRVARLTLGSTGGEGLRPIFRIAEWDREEDADALLRRGRTEVRGED